jgi:hypothetical protein
MQKIELHTDQNSFLLKTVTQLISNLEAEKQ